MNIKITPSIYPIPQPTKPTLQYIHPNYITEPIVDKFDRIIDIGSKKDFPSGTLSNFTESHFVLDNKQINSMEGFLQALKTPDIKEQEETCKLIGYQAKKMGNLYKQRENYNPQIAYWNGKTYNRESKSFDRLIKRAYKAKYEADPLFRKALKATQNYTLTHTIGKQSKKETILTEQEFIDILTNLRDKNQITKFKLALKKLLKMK